MVAVVGKISDADLERWRDVKARMDAAEMLENVEYDFLVALYREHYALTAEMVEAYDVDDDECWHISHYTGNITYCDT